MLHNFEMSYNTISLVPLEYQHIHLLRILRNKARFYFKCSNVISAEDQENWFSLYKSTPNDYMFAVLKNDFFIGASALYGINQTLKTAEFGRLVIDKDIPTTKGTGKEATYLTCLIGFQLLGLNAIFLEVLDNNISAIKTYYRVGFTEINRDKNIIKMKLKKEQILHERGLTL